MLRGVDLSHWQSNFDAFGSVDFAIIKATEGVGYVDPACDTLYQRAKKAGKLLGVYHFARPDLNNSAVAEADWFVNNIQGYIKEAILVLDWESGYLGNVSWAKQFLDRVKERTGIKAILYASRSPINSFDWSSVANADYGLWVADYGANTGQEGNKPAVKWWSFYILWQYTSRGRVAGYNGDVDLNNFYGDAETWRKYATSSSSPAPAPAPTPTPEPKKSNEEIAKEVIEGKWGNGEERKQRLTEAGYDYNAIQSIVNSIVYQDFKVGDKVKTTKTGNGASDGSSNVARSGLVGTITRIKDGAKYPYLVSNGDPIGWYKKDALQRV